MCGCARTAATERDATTKMLRSRELAGALRRLSPRMRRVYLAQYSPEPILNLKGEIADFAEPLLRDGVKVPSASPL